MPFFSANASAALVGLPSLSNAIAAGGPHTTNSFDGVCSARFSINTAKRRGAAKGLIAVKDNASFFKCDSIVSAKDNIKFFKAFGGNSSVPSSTRKSVIIFLLLPLKLVGVNLQVPGETRALCDYRNRLVQQRVPVCARAK